MSLILLAYNRFSFITTGHIDVGVLGGKMQIYVQFHGFESSQNCQNSATETHMESQSGERLD